MAESIKKSDIIENDILKSVIIEFEQAQVKIKAFNDELRQTARLSKDGLNNVKFNSVTDINQAKIAILEANNAIKQKVLLEKGEIEVSIALEQAKVKQAKAENDLNQQKARSEAITNKLTRSEQMLQSAYSRVNSWLGKLRNEYRDLAIKLELTGKLTDAEIKRMINIEGRMQSYDNALKKVDASMGNHQRNVGNYAMAYNGLGNSVNQLTREMPAFANSVGTGFMAISNNLPIFFDEITKIKNANKELIAQGQPVKSVFSQIGASIFSVGTLLSVGVTLLTVYGSKIVEWVSNLGGANDKLEKQRKIREQINKEYKDGIEYVGKESAQYVGLIQTLKRTNENSQERRDLIIKINDEYGTTLKNISDESKFQEQLNQSVKDYIEYKKQEFQIKVNEEKIARNLQYQLKLEKEIKDTQNEKFQAQIKYDLQKKALEGKDINDLLLRDQTGLTKTTNKLIEQQKQLEILNKHLEDYGLKIATATDEKGGLGFTDGDTSAKSTKAISFEKDLTLAIQEENIKQIELEYIQQQETIKLNAKKQIDSINSEIKTKEEIAKMDKDSLAKYNQFLIDKVTLEKEITETSLIELKKLDEKFTEEQKKIINDFNDYYFEQLTKKYEAEYQLKLKGLEDNEKIWETNLNNSDSSDKEIAEQTKKNRIETLKEIIKLNKEYHKNTTDEELELSKLTNTKIVIDTKQTATNLNNITKLTADYFIEQSNRKIAQIEKEQQQHEKAYSLYSDLAKNGNIQAKESLALENQQIVEANKKKQAELKKQAMWKLIEGGVSAYAKNAGDSTVKNPVMKTFSDITLLTQLLKTLPSFEVGTEDTGKNGNGIDGRGGFHAILHPNERVLTKEQNQLIGNVSNEDLALTMNKLNSGELVKLKEGATSNVGNWQNMALISEIQDLKNIIKNKPDFKIEAGEIIQGAMSIVETKTTKNSIYSNRYIVK
jgi:hypothetical protein